MVIPKVLAEDAFNSAPKEDQALYVKGDDGNYNFVGENADTLRRGKMRVAAEKEEAIKELETLKEKYNEMQSLKDDEDNADKMKKADDVKTLDEVWKAKHTKEINAREEQINKLTTTILNQYKERIIAEKASEIAIPEFVDIAKVLLNDRIKITLDSKGVPTPVVYDADRNVTKDSISDLTEELKKDKRYERMMKGAEVGSGANKPRSPGRASPIGDSKSPAIRNFDAVNKEFRHFQECSPSELLKMMGE